MAMVAPYVVLNTKTFHYDSKTRTMSDEASTCGFTRVQPIWDDAADVGVFVQSHKTSAVYAFVLVDRMEDEGDIVGWKFKSADPKLNINLIIWND